MDSFTKKLQKDLDGRTPRVFKEAIKISLEVGVWRVIDAYAREERLTRAEVVTLGMKEFLKDRSALWGTGYE